MSQTETKNHKRINISLPVDTLQRIDRVANKGNRSRLIDQAVCFYLEEIRKNNLREQLKAGAIANAERDRELAQDWFSLEEELCLREEK